MAKLNVDDDLITILRADARSHGVEPEARAEQILRDALRPRLRRSLIFKEADRIAAMTPKGVTQIDSTVLIREDRDR